MNTFIKDYGDCLKEVFVRFNSDEVNAEYQKAITKVQAEAKFPGYRPGKVPADIIEKNFGQDLSNTMFRGMLNQTISKLAADRVTIYAEPNIRPLTNLAKGEPFAFSLTFESAPVIEKPLEIKSLSVDFEEVFVDDKMIEARMQENFKTFEAVSGKIQEGDAVTVKVNINGETTEKSLDASSVKSLVGKKSGDKVSIPLDEMGYYLVEFLELGKDTVDVEITGVERAVVQEVTDEIVSQMSSVKTAAEYRETLRKGMEESARSLSDYNKRMALMDAIVQNVKLTAPKSLFMHDAHLEFEHLLEHDLNESRVPLTELISGSEIKGKMDTILKKTYDNIVFYLAVKDFGDKNGIDASQETINRIAANNARKSEMTISDYKEKSSKEEWNSVVEKARFEAALDRITSQVSFKAKTRSPLVKK